MNTRKKLDLSLISHEETKQRLAIYDNVRPLKRPPNFARIGKISSRLTQSREILQSVPKRIVDDPERDEEKIIAFVPPPTQNKKRSVEVCDYCHMDYDIDDGIHGWFRVGDGKIEPCPKCSKPVIRARNCRKAETAVRQLVQDGKFLDMQNLPSDSHMYSLMDYPGDDTYLEKINAFVSGEIRELYLFGLPGRGKTGLGISAIHELWERGEHPIFISHERYIELLKENFASNAVNNGIKTILGHTETVVIDDFGAAYASDPSFIIKESLEVLEMRHSAGLKTLITSNLATDGLAVMWEMEKYRKTGFQPVDRIVSRLKGWYKVVEIVGSDLRQGE